MSTDNVIVNETDNKVVVSEPGPQGSQGPSTMPVPFFLPLAATAGVKLPTYIVPVAGTLSAMRGRAETGSGVTYRFVVNGTPAATSAATDQTVVTTNLNVPIAVGDRLQVEIVNPGTASDVSITGVITV